MPSNDTKLAKFASTIEFDADVWEWMNNRVAALKSGKPSYSRRELIHDLARAAMAKEISRNAKEN